MNPQFGDLISWCRLQQGEARRQLQLFGSAGVKALLQMPDGTTQDITDGVVQHQTENIAAFDRLVAALESRP